MPEDDTPCGIPLNWKRADGFGFTIRYQLKNLGEMSR